MSIPTMWFARPEKKNSDQPAHALHWLHEGACWSYLFVLIQQTHNLAKT